jgi:hypothetical protein
VDTEGLRVLLVSDRDQRRGHRKGCAVQKNHRTRTAESQTNPDQVAEQTEPTKRLPFAEIPHAVAADLRLKKHPIDRGVIVALLYWALDKDHCAVSDWRLADYLGVTERTVQRSLRRLSRIGHIRCVEDKPSLMNMTGRTIFLCWREDPRYLPAPPDRRAEKGQTRAVTHDRPTRKSERTRPRSQSGSDTGVRPALTRTSDKEEEQKNPQELMKMMTSGSSSSSTKALPSAEGEREQPDPGALAEVLAAARPVFGDSPRVEADALATLARYPQREGGTQRR